MSHVSPPFPRLCPIAESERRPGSDADAPGDLLLATAHAAVLQPLSTHRARLAADVSGRLPLKNESNLDRNTEQKRGKKRRWRTPELSACSFLVQLAPRNEPTHGQSTLQEVILNPKSVEL